MTTQPGVINRDQQPYVAIRKQVAMQDIPTELPPLIGEVFGWLEKKGTAPAGAPFFRYFSVGGFVGKSVYPGGGVYAGNPECAEIALLDPPVPKCVIQGAIDGFGSASEQFASGSPVTLGQLQHLVSSLSRFKSSFYSWHFLLLCSGYLPDPQGETFPHGSRT